MQNPADLDWTGRRVLVVGDVMLDRTVTGEVERISPEAPVPILRRRNCISAPGGAANVARNIVSLGGSATLIGRVGHDAVGAELHRLCEQAAIDVRFVAARVPTTEKVRFVAQAQQIMRLDSESCEADICAEDAMIAIVMDCLASADVLVLSDYAKGTLGNRALAAVIAASRAEGVPIIVDPKRADFAAYAGVDVIKPNRAELLRATGIDPSDDDGTVRAASVARARIGGGAVLATRGSDGLTLCERSGTLHLRSRAREVYDVTGAGDTVAAMFALALAAGARLAECAELASRAAGLVVAKSGTAVTTREEVIEAVRGVRRDAFVNLEEASGIVEKWRSHGCQIGFTNGCFDLLHPGHLHLLGQAAERCDRLVVGLNSDASVRRLKGPARPCQDQASRAAVLAALACVDLVVIFEEDTPIEAIRALRPDVLVKGADYARMSVVGADFVTAGGGRVFLADLLSGHSTTARIGAVSRAAEQSRRAIPSCTSEAAVPTQ